MKTRPDCVPCMLRRVLFQANLCEGGNVEESMKAGLKAYAEAFSYEGNSAEIATSVHRSAYSALGCNDPYKESKILSDEIAGKHLGILKSFIDNSKDEFEAVLKTVIAGNVLDIGVALDDPRDLISAMDEILRNDLDANEIDRLANLIDGSGTILYLFDNCGESQFDKFLIRHLKRLGKRVVGVVKGEPILNDVTMEDALRIGLDRELDSILTTNSFSVGINLRKIGDDLRSEMGNGSTIIISKGMGNYESLSDESLKVPIAYLLKAKCIPVANSLGVPLGEHVIRIVHPR